jgi:mannose-6-phosphate isomerase-like protein (cupin superfamily)
MEKESALQIFEWAGEGYFPLVFSHDWQVALLNWEPVAAVSAIYEVERHNQSDEVFILWRGKAALVIAEQRELRIVEAIPGVVYNVPMGTWHTVVGNRESSWIIIENRNTHINDTEMRDMNAKELGDFHAILPPWAKASSEG